MYNGAVQRVHTLCTSATESSRYFTTIPSLINRNWKYLLSQSHYDCVAWGKPAFAKTRGVGEGEAHEKDEAEEEEEREDKWGERRRGDAVALCWEMFILRFPCIWSSLAHSCSISRSFSVLFSLLLQKKQIVHHSQELKRQVSCAVCSAQLKLNFRPAARSKVSKKKKSPAVCHNKPQVERITSYCCPPKKGSL